MRMPDSIAVYSAGGQDYIITANEGDDKEYGDFEEKQKFKDVMSCSSTPDFESDFTEFSFLNAQVGTDACTNARADASTNAIADTRAYACGKFRPLADPLLRPRWNQ